VASTMNAGRLKAPKDIPPHLAHLWKIALLKPVQEQQLSGRMNFLKFRANAGRCRLNPDRPNVLVMDRIEKDLENARQIRDHIIQANLRLVVSIARRFVIDVTSPDEVISDSNLILMKAVDRFKTLMQDTLSPREQTILDLRPGLNTDDGGQTLPRIR